jgi:hypothetical protein
VTLSPVYSGLSDPANETFNGSFGINSLGTGEYFTRLYIALGIPMTDDVLLHYISVKDKSRLRQVEKARTKQQKKHRLKRKFLAMTTDEAKAKKERATCAGTYKSGMNMADGTVDGYTEDDLKLAATPRPQNNPKNNRKDAVCPHCFLTGHSTTHSRACLYHNSVPAGIPAAAAALLEDDKVPTLAGPIGTVARNSLAFAVRDTANFDSYPLREDAPSDVSLSAFQDADTWSDGDALSVGSL